MSEYIWVVEAIDKIGLDNQGWSPTVFVGLIKKDAEREAQAFKKRNHNSFKVRVRQYFK